MQVYDIPLDEARKETTRHGSFDFPLAVYTTEINKNILGFINWHWHQELQFCMVTRGSVVFHVGQAEQICSEKEGIFINAGQLHMAKNSPGSDGAYICLDFHPRLIAGFSGSSIERSYISPYIQPSSQAFCLLRPEIGWQKEILDALETACAQYHSPQPDKLHIQLRLLCVWHTMIHSFFETAPSRSRAEGNHRIREILAYIDAHYAERLTLEELASLAHYAPTVCCREFKKQAGCTIFQYLMNLRLQHAAELLLSSDASVTDIALSCGFGSSSYFIREFRKKTGIPPAAYRKQCVGARAGG